MKRIGALTVAVVMTVAACGGSNETVAEPDVEVEAVDDDGAFRLAGGDVKVINGCRIEPNTWCPSVNLLGVNLSNADLRGAHLWRANLSGATLSGANLSGADLFRADLQGANLSGVNLWGANLTGARLFNADLQGAHLFQTNLSGATFCRTIMPNGSIRNDNC